MLTVAVPLLKVTAADVNPPPLSTTDPVGTALPLAPPTTTATVKACAAVMLVADGVTVTVGFVCGGGWIDTTAVFEVPPPGAGVVTWMLNCPLWVMSVASTWAVSEAPLR